MSLDTKLTLALHGYTPDKVGLFSCILGLEESFVRETLAIPISESTALGIDSTEKEMLNKVAEILANDVNTIDTPDQQAVSDALLRVVRAIGLQGVDRERFNSLVQFVIENWDEFKMIHQLPHDPNPDGDADELESQLKSVPNIKRPQPVGRSASISSAMDVGDGRQYHE